MTRIFLRPTSHKRFSAYLSFALNHPLYIQSQRENIMSLDSMFLAEPYFRKVDSIFPEGIPWTRLNLSALRGLDSAGNQVSVSVWHRVPLLQDDWQFFCWMVAHSSVQFNYRTQNLHCVLWHQWCQIFVRPRSLLLVPLEPPSRTDNSATFGFKARVHSSSLVLFCCVCTRPSIPRVISGSQDQAPNLDHSCVRRSRYRACCAIQMWEITGSMPGCLGANNRRGQNFEQLMASSHPKSETEGTSGSHKMHLGLTRFYKKVLYITVNSRSAPVYW